MSSRILYVRLNVCGLILPTPLMRLGYMWGRRPRMKLHVWRMHLPSIDATATMCLFAAFLMDKRPCLNARWVCMSRVYLKGAFAR